jgi:outer membrane receptor protein involved in Fe transport
MPPPRGHLAIRWSARGLWVEPLLTLVYRQDKIAKGEITTPGYGIADVTVGKTLAVGEKISHDLVVGIKNIGDKLYRDHLATSRGYDMYGPGRSFYVSLRMNYN